MGSKTRVGMLCVFKENKPTAWYGYFQPGDPPKPKSVFHTPKDCENFGSRYVTVLQKKGAIRFGKWVSFSKVLGQDTNGKAIILWVISKMLKSQESRKSQSKF